MREVSDLSSGLVGRTLKMLAVRVEVVLRSRQIDDRPNSCVADPSDYQHVRTGQIANAMPPLVDHLMRYMSAAYAAPRM